MDEAVQQTLRNDTDPFGFNKLTYVENPQESMALNRREGAFVVIASSGMCESGRVVHHLKHAISKPENTVVIMGFQAEHTLGRRIAERHERVRIFDRDYLLNCHVENLSGLSAHADTDDFRWWFERMHATSHIGQAFLVHGEGEALLAQAKLLDEFCDEHPIVPERGRVYEV